MLITMKPPLYSARIGESLSIAEEASYDTLLRSIIEFTVRAAVARSIDEDDWEHEELRRKGLAALQIVRNGRAIWADRLGFEAEVAEAQRERVELRFSKSNQLDPELYLQLDRDLRGCWRLAGYDVPSVLSDMRKLFVELERDVADHAASAREGLVNEILKAVVEHFVRTN
jgi:hypothetical protein